MARDSQYIGNELDVFALATNWKKYLRAEIGAFISGSVIEVGAGLGTTTKALWRPGLKHWLCLEPDAQLCLRLQRNLGQWRLTCEIRTGTLESVLSDPVFDCILYVDVLEHIENDS